MFPRIRIAFGLALLLTLLTTVIVFAKGNFSFITIKGPGMKDALRVTDPALTADFFAFADFSQNKNKTEAPADPGAGYEITRYYINGRREEAFDQLHYYPDAGLVYYDGFGFNGNGGWSEYDGKWYKAKAGIKTEFEKALLHASQSAALTAVATDEPTPSKQPVASIAPTQSVTAKGTAPSKRAQPVASGNQTQSLTPIAMTTGLALILALAFWLRKPPTH